MSESASNFFSGIKVVAFDFDQTLVDEAFSLRRRWQDTLKKFSHLDDELEDTFLSMFDSKGHKTHETHFHDTVRKLNLSNEHDQAIWAYFFETRSDREHVYESVEDVITLLKQKGFRVGVLTDGVKDYQEGRLKVSGLHGLFDFFYYGDKHQKPDPAFFKRCIEDEKILPQELVYIGDHVVKDIEGALAVGAEAIFIAEGNEAKPPKKALYFKTMKDFYLWLKKE